MTAERTEIISPSSWKLKTYHGRSSHDRGRNNNLPLHPHGVPQVRVQVAHKAIHLDECEGKAKT
jgi:hypothetical protein